MFKKPEAGQAKGKKEDDKKVLPLIKNFKFLWFFLN
jgi:hypothetical protein